MSSVLFLFLAHLGLGIAATLLLVKREAGVQFFRFNAGLGAVLLLIALAFRPEFVDGGQTSFLGFVALVIATGALLLYWATVGRALATLRNTLLWITVVAGAAAIIVQAFSWSAIEIGSSPALTALSFLSSAALLGGSCTAMILGHWYLVLPSMNVSLLQGMVKFHIGSTIVRIVVVGVVVAVALSSWQSPGGIGLTAMRCHWRGFFFGNECYLGYLVRLCLHT